VLVASEDISKDLEIVREEANKKVDLVREEMNAQFAKITALI